MSQGPFGLNLVQLLFEHRNAAATALFQLATLLGDVEGYVFLIAVIYVAYDKRLGFRLAVVVLATMSLNHFLKMLIANPRPFVDEGTWAVKWAVSAETARQLLTEYSTPSGHAMAGAAFYGYLYGSVKSSAVRTFSIAAILLTGLSRPYLGVHYFEDVLLGWAIGLAIAVVALRYGEVIRDFWNDWSLSTQVLIVVGASLCLWSATRMLPGPTPGSQPLAFLSYTGFLCGVVLAFPLESRWVKFDPTSWKLPARILAVSLCVALVLGTLFALKRIFGLVAPDPSVAGNILRYVRYAAAGVAGLLLAPFLFVRLRLANASG